MGGRDENLRLRMLGSLFVCLLVLLVTAVIVMQNVHRQQIETEVRSSVQGLDVLFRSAVESDTNLLHGLIEFVQKDPALQQAWLARDREALQRYSQPILENLREKYRVTHFYFHDLDRVCFLRVHKPSRHGDLITRVTLAQSVDREDAAAGIELGSLGTFALRVVHPWYVDGELIGYLELGEEIEHITPVLKRTLGVDVLVMIDKTLLNREKWSDGLKMLGREGDWDQFSDRVLIDSTVKQIPVGLLSFTHQRHNNETLGELRSRNHLGRDYWIGSSVLLDAGQRQVGELVALADVTDEMHELAQATWLLVGLGAPVSGLLLLLFWGYVGRIADRLDAKKQLLEESAEYAKQLAERANEASRAKSEFLATVSHELRTPMNGVIGMTDLLLDSELTKEQRDCAETVRLSGEGLLQLIEGILDFSKIEGDELEIEQHDFNLKIIVEQVRDRLMTQACERGLELSCRIDSDLPSRVRGDPARLRQILFNLCDNAIKFTEHGEVSVHVSRSDEDDQGGDEGADQASVRFSVRDTGIGMSPDLLQRLFQPFSQADSSTTRGYGGIGLGLALSKRLAERMGGQLGVESEEDRGSTFWFTLALEKAAEPEPRVLSEAGASHKSRILVVEDNLVNQKVALKMLKTLDYRAEAVANGLEAVSAVQEVPYDLVLMDCQMPEMDGYLATARIRALAGAVANTPIIALTANAMQGDRERCLDAGMNDYLSKPVRSAVLAEMLQKWLSVSMDSSGETATGRSRLHS